MKSMDTGSESTQAVDSFTAFSNSSRLALKLSSYFDVYDHLLSPYIDRAELTVIEFGVLHGGSLEMWRSLFGAKARIIGVDLNPAAKANEALGFEIHILNQEDPDSLKRLFSTIGPIDVLLDDGAHTNAGVSRTILAALPHMRNGGIVIVEDVHTSFDPDFGNPSRNSSFNMVAEIAEEMSRAYLGNKSERDGFWQHNFGVLDRVSSIEFFESIFALRIRNSSTKWAAPELVVNAAEVVQPEVADLRNSQVASGEAFGISGMIGIIPDRLKAWIPRSALAPIILRAAAKKSNSNLRNSLVRDFGR